MDPNSQGFPAMPKDGRLPTAKEVERIIENHPELHKPLMFANHQRKFVAFTWISCIGKSARANCKIGLFSLVLKRAFSKCPTSEFISLEVLLIFNNSFGGKFPVAQLN